MKIIKKTTIFLLAIFIFTSCADFLDPNPREQYTEMDAWKSIENTYLYINGFYKPIYEYGPYGVKYAGVSLTDGFSDILRYSASVMGQGTGGDVNKVVYSGNISPQGNILSDYSYEYNRIRRINEFLYGLNTYVKYDENVKLVMEAQARFFRAYLHFMLMRNHGSIVIRDHIDGPNEAYKERSPASVCWDFIESDLDFAADNLPEEWDKDNVGRLTKGAAYGFKSRVMLYAKRWDKAAEAAQKVIDKEGQFYDLTLNYADVFTQNDKKETVLGFRFHGEIVHSVLFDKLYSPKGDFPADNNDIKCLAVPTQEMVDSYYMADGSKFDWNNPEHAANPYENREPRFYASILYNGASWKGRQIETFVGGKDGFKPYGVEPFPNSTTTGYYIRKLLNEKVTNMSVKGTQEWAEVRYAEVLLNQAEALNENGKSSEALDPLNKVRSRAKLPNVTETNQARLREIIRHERKIELAFEGQRYWDLRRWEVAYDLLNGTRMHGMKITKNEDNTLHYEVVDCDGEDRYFEMRYYQFPIPQAEIQNNPLCTQIDKW